MPEELMRDLESFGLFFEDLAVRDLRVYAGTLGGRFVTIATMPGWSATPWCIWKMAVGAPLKSNWAGMN